MNDMKRHEVTFDTGLGRNVPGIVNYMQVVVKIEDGREIELYAEELTPSKMGFNTMNTCKRLREDIEWQAAANGIDPDSLEFWWA